MFRTIYMNFVILSFLFVFLHVPMIFSYVFLLLKFYKKFRQVEFNSKNIFMSNKNDEVMKN